MRAILVFSLALMTVVVARPEHYTDKYDNLDLNEILNNSRLRMPYVKCLLGEGKCSPEAKELKSHVGEALANRCAKCTPTQHDGTRKVIGYLINHDSESWHKLANKYDPAQKYVAMYEKELKDVTKSSE